MHMRTHVGLGVMRMTMFTCHPCAREPEAGGWRCSGQPELHTEMIMMKMMTTIKVTFKIK